MKEGLVVMIKFANKTLANYVEFKLDKLDNDFILEELLKVDEVVIDLKVETDSIINILNDVLKLENVKTLTIRNGYITNEACKMLLNLKKLNGLVLEDCEIENANALGILNLKSIGIINCQVKDYEFLRLFKNLEELTLISEIVSITLINKLVNLKYLQLSYSNLLETDNIVLNNIEEIYLDNTNLTDLDFLKNMPKLKRVSIDERQHEKNLELFKNLENNHILVLNENMVWFTE